MAERAVAYAPGFQSQDREVAGQPLALAGKLPAWLAGTLLRNGPAVFDFGGQRLAHWFDGMAKLHRFTFAGGQVEYACRLLESDSLKRNRDAGNIQSREFGTDPEMSLWRRLKCLASMDATDNANVNVARIGGHHVALTETPAAIEFCPVSLATTGKLAFDGPLSGQVTTAHPQSDPDKGDLYNILIQMGPSSRYVIYRIPAGTTARRPLATIAVSEPGYLHSFAVTTRFVVLVEFPFTVRPLELMLSGKPYIANYRWRGERGMRAFAVDKQSGVVTTFAGGACFAFHHVNAFEDGADIVCDLVAYDDAGIVRALYLDSLLAPGRPLPAPGLRRLRLSARTRTVESEVISAAGFELPRINQSLSQSAGYRYCWGLGQGEDGGFLDRINKIDLDSGEVTTWHSKGSYAGEPVFVARPGAQAADDGVLLALVLEADAARSCLLVLDARSLAELARLTIPAVVPFGFHGQFYPGG